MVLWPEETAKFRRQVSGATYSYSAVFEAEVPDDTRVDVLLSRTTFCNDGDELKKKRKRVTVADGHLTELITSFVLNFKARMRGMHCDLEIPTQDKQTKFAIATGGEFFVATNRDE